MDKVVVYCGTANLYPFIYCSMKSLLEYNSPDRIYFLIEDDQFPYPIPDQVRCINAKKIATNFFPKNSQVYTCPLTYMSFMRLALPKILLNETIVLYLDCDTLIVDNIDEIWDIDMSHHCFGAVRETYGYPARTHLINSGIMLMNLTRLRTSQVDNYLLYMSNHGAYENGDQTVINFVIDTEIRYIPSIYNGTGLCHQPKDGKAKIQHWAGTPRREYYRNFVPYIRKYLPQLIPNMAVLYT